MKAAFILFLFFLPLFLYAQPRQIDYFHKDAGTNWRALAEPGDYILSNSVLIGNQHLNSTVSFSLSWDETFEKRSTSVFALEPMYASTFGINNKKGCWIKVMTSHGEGEVVETTYFLEKGNCYAIYWNRKCNRWDVASTVCRKEH